MHRQGIPDIDLFIEQDTERTPEPTKFYLLHEGQVVESFRYLKAAVKRYDEMKRELNYVPKPVQSETRPVHEAVLEDWFNRTELYWSGSSSHRPTRKSRR